MRCDAARASRVAPGPANDHAGRCQLQRDGGRGRDLRARLRARPRPGRDECRAAGDGPDARRRAAPALDALRCAVARLESALGRRLRGTPGAELRSARRGRHGRVDPDLAALPGDVRLLGLRDGDLARLELVGRADRAAPDPRGLLRASVARRSPGAGSERVRSRCAASPGRALVEPARDLRRAVRRRGAGPNGFGGASRAAERAGWDHACSPTCSRSRRRCTSQLRSSHPTC
jgi:hypothetical protein